MTTAKIEELKQAAKLANYAYEAEKARLTAAGLKSNERYALLKPLKSIADEAHARYDSFVKGQIIKELNKITAEDLPIRQAAARARSPWKMAKFNAANAAKLA